MASNRAAGARGSPIMRWLPFIPLGLAALGLALQIGGARGRPVIIVSVASLVALFLRLHGPLGNQPKGKTTDPNERYWYARATLMGTSSVTVVTFLGLIAFLLSDELDSWKPAEMQDWCVIIFVLITVSNSAEALYASSVKKPVGELA